MNNKSPIADRLKANFGNNAAKPLSIETSHPQLQMLVETVAAHCKLAYAGLGLFDQHTARYDVMLGADPIIRPRNEVICEYVGADNKTVVYPDVELVPAIAKLQVVKDTGLRFYAGSPVHDEQDRVIGVLCFWDDAPRNGLAEHEQSLIESSARLAGGILKLERQSQQRQALLEKYESLLTANLELEKAVDAKALLVDDEFRVLHATNELLNVVGRRRDELVGLKLSSLIEAAAPMDLKTAMAQASQGNERVQCSVRLRLKGQHSHVFHMRIRIASQGASPTYAVSMLTHRQVAGGQRSYRFRTTLLQAMRRSPPREELLDLLIDLIQNQVRGKANRAFVSMITGPQSRKIYARSNERSFVKDLENHHDFTPQHSICASSAQSHRFIACGDTLSESRWPDYDWLYFTHNIRSVWCMPIEDEVGLTLGLVTVFRTEPGVPDENDLSALEESAQWAATLLFNADDCTSELRGSNRETNSLSALSDDIERLETAYGSKSRAFLVALDVSIRTELGIEDTYLEEMIYLHFGNISTLHKMQGHIWFCLASAPDAFQISGLAEALQKALAMDQLGPNGYQRKALTYAVSEVTPETEVTKLISELGRQVMKP